MPDGARQAYVLTHEKIERQIFEAFVTLPGVDSHLLDRSSDILDIRPRTQALPLAFRDIFKSHLRVLLTKKPCNRNVRSHRILRSEDAATPMRLVGDRSVSLSSDKCIYYIQIRLAMRHYRNESRDRIIIAVMILTPNLIACTHPILERSG